MNISLQQKQSSLVGTGNKGDCFIVALLISQLEKDMSKKRRDNYFNRAVSVKNVNTLGNLYEFLCTKSKMKKCEQKSSQRQY